jgi:hypothetical protein
MCINACSSQAWHGEDSLCGSVIEKYEAASEEEKKALRKQ